MANPLSAPLVALLKSFGWTTQNLADKANISDKQVTRMRGEAEVFSLVGESLPKVIEAFEKERPKLDPARRSGVDNLLAGFDGKIDRFLLRE